MNNNIISRKVRLSIKTIQYESSLDSLFSRMAEKLRGEIEQLEGALDGIDDGDFFDESFIDDAFAQNFDFMESDDSGGLELVTEAEMTDDGKRIEIKYNETELTGMDGAVTQISFEREVPGIVSMLRGGTVYTVLIFEKGKRHICAYETPYMPFELCIFTRKVDNFLNMETGGSLDLDYFIEIRGAGTERTVFRMDVTPISDTAVTALTESDEIIEYKPADPNEDYF
jgi:Uncharacterized protein conserved in bacteria